MSALEHKLIRIITTLPMTTTTVSLFSIVLLCSTAAQGMKELHSNTELPISFSVNDFDDAGICKTMAETKGYTCEEHKVTTKDGYILSMQRLPAGRSGKKADKPPVLLQHGLLSDGRVWMLNSDESLGFILADNGYDVWLGNARGTRYSRQHTSLNPNHKAYWDWSWDELVSYDLPSFVQYVHSQTGQKMHYAGHSLGTLMVLADLSQGKMMNLLRSAALLSPIAYLNHISSPIARLGAETLIANDIYWLGIREFIPGGDAAGKFLESICHILKLNCSDFVTRITGPNCCVDSSVLNIYFNHVLEPTATKNMIHLSQMVRTGKIARYDYGGAGENMKHYGQLHPPLYDMKAIPNQFPLFLIYGKPDMLSDVTDVQLLLNELQHGGKKFHQLFMEDYAHLDFVMAVNAKQSIFEPIITFFQNN